MTGTIPNFNSMDLWMRDVAPGIYCYLPFRMCRRPAPKEVLDLKYLCKVCIVKSLTVTRIPVGMKQLGLPNPLIFYLTTLTTENFDEIDCAPFGDVFGLNFFHRALTYKVHCLFDDNEYLATHASWSLDSKHEKDDVQKWVRLQHDNVMCIYAFVEDTVTNNVFYLFDYPQLCLKQLSVVVAKSDEVLPEAFVWRLLADLGSAAQNILNCGIHYPPFGLHNAFIVGEKLVLENGVTRKSWQSGSCETLEGGCELKGPEEQAVWCLARMVLKLTEHQSHSSYSDSLNEILKDMISGKSLDDTVLLARKTVKQRNADSFSITGFIQLLQRTISTGTLSVQ